MDGLTRGQLAERAEVNRETIRFYEDTGLLPKSPRTTSGYRKFSASTIERLAFVKRAKTLGFSLEEVRELLVFLDGHIDACAEVRDLLRKKLAVVRGKRAELEKLEANLNAALGRCNRALTQQKQHAAACPVLTQIADPNSKNRRR